MNRTSQSRTKKRVLNMKVCVIGDPGAGKSFLIRHLIDSQEELTPTEEYQVSLYQLDIKHTLMQIQLWDCSTNYFKFHKHLRHAYFRNSSAALLMFDITLDNWQQNIHNWISQAYQNQCYLVYAIATRLSPLILSQSTYKKKIQVQEHLIEQNFQQLKLQAEVLFQKYSIGLHFLQQSPNIQKHFQDLFTRLHVESQIVSRNSMARGMQLPFDFEERISKEEQEQREGGQ